MTDFIHLHVHSHYSILDGMSKVPDLVDKCMKNGMYAMALTDHGEMYGIKELTDYAKKVNGKTKDKIAEQEKIIAAEESTPEEKEEAQKKIEKLKKQFFKPIIGVEAYCARRLLTDKDPTVKEINPENGREQVVDRSGWHLILIAKNKTGYKSLCKLVSQAWVDGFYGRPRIDKKILEKYKDGLIVCSACLGGEIPQKIIAGKIDEAEESIRWFKSVFGDDYYLEIQRHKTDKFNADTQVYERQKQVNPIILELAKKTNTKVIATNDVHFVEEEHGEAHDRLICLSTGKDIDDPNRMHYTKQEWLKTPEEMETIFADVPEALTNTLEIADKVETYSIESGPIMPMFDIPEEFGTEAQYHEKFTDEDLFNEFTRDEHGNVVLSQSDAESKIKKLGGYEKLYRIKLEADYLAKLAWEGAKVRYGETLTDEQKERIIFELHIMKTMGFPGYFLIVQDYIRAAREELGVSVGPGRGSAAGSVVAYCLKITDIDPLKYDLLFERFLNPDRISLPDIDVDFDDDGRGEVLRWVTQKYGKEKVAHIITYGTMATKSSIKDVGRVQKVPLSTVNNLVSFIPDKFGEEFADPETKKIPKVNIKNCLKYIKELKDALEGEDRNISSMLEYAEELEDTIRQTGIHACGVIIGAADLTNFAPLATVKDKETDEDVLVTQYDGHVIESVGLIKMDFLGLKTLSIIKEAVKNIKHSHGIDIDVSAIPIDDPETYELYSRGDTIGTFQFESPGMQKYLRELHPSTFEDLIAMNALYRPGPMDYIPTFIDRKLGREPIQYDIPIMEKYLKDTYGVTVYQEQVMLLSRLLANFTRGESDTLRKAMGKKQIETMNKLYGKFIAGGEKNGYDKKALDKIWADWVKFASYAFNKSHATCYSWVAYQTAYLKAHFPADYMAANLTRSKDNISDVTKFMAECQRLKINVLGPDINESETDFTTNSNGDIRFGMGGVKGVGEAAVDAILKERRQNGPYKDIFNFVERVNLNACNRKNIECLALAGAFDTLNGIKREQFFATNSKGELYSEVLIRYGNMYQADKQAQKNSLWGDLGEISITKPASPTFEEWDHLTRLNKERELVGVYLSAHPLDPYYPILKYVCNIQMAELDTPVPNKELLFGGMVTATKDGVSKKNGDPFKIITVEDYSGSHELAFFGKDFVTFRNYLEKGLTIFIRGAFTPSKYNPNDIRLKVNSISLISEVKDSLINNFTIDIYDDKITQDFVSDFLTVVEENPGKVPLHIKIRERETGIGVNLLSRTVGVEVNNKLTSFVEEQLANEVLEFKVG